MSDAWRADFIHTQKRNPQTNLRDANMFWDFLSLTPESIHQVTILFSDRGIPKTYRHMNGYSSHTFKLVNKEGKQFWVKFHFKTEQGIECLTQEEADRIAGENPDYATEDLFNSIAKGEFPAWRAYIQVMEYEDAWKYRFNPFDVTKVWSHKDYPLIPFGRLVLNRNPENYFAETEQSAFSPAALVPGIEPSLDKMLQGRLFSYNDTHRHRLGPNYLQIPINAPFATKVRNQERDGAMTVNGNQGSAPNYFPNTVEGSPATCPNSLDAHPFDVSGPVGRHRPNHPNDDFVQAGTLYRSVMTPEQRTRLVNNIVGHLKNARKDVQLRMIEIFTKADQDYGRRIRDGLVASGAKL